MNARIRFSATWGSAIAVSILLASCGGGGSGSVTSIPYVPGDQLATCTPGADVTGVWKTVSDNATLIPGSASVNFFSYNQPSINDAGMVVFRGRAREASGEGSGGSGGAGSGGMTHGVFAVDACASHPVMYTVADTSTLVPDPNNTGAHFTEFPSFPRIDIGSAVIATRGQSTPVWTLDDGTKLGTTGVYATLSKQLGTAVNLLGGVPQYSNMQVPGAGASAPLRFDQFPGSPAVTQGRYVVFKGNFTLPAGGATGVYYRDLSGNASAVQRIADTSMTIPGTALQFGSTAPPSAAGGDVVFTGLDNEDAPTAGGIYLAPVQPDPVLQPLVLIGITEVPDSSGAPLPPMAGASAPPTFSQVGEGLGFDGRYVSFWGAWDTQDPTQMRKVALQCPSDGNKDLINYCQSQYGGPGGIAQMPEPVNQGIFVYDTQNHSLWMVARAGVGEQFQDLLFWNYSGKAPAAGSSGSTDAEPPRWRASAFSTVEAGRGVLFKGSLTPVSGASTPASGIYGAALSGSGMGPVFKVVELGDPMSAIDPAAPAGSTVSSVGLEREALRGGWLTLTVSSLNPALESWAGIYVTYFPGAWHVQQPDPAVMGVLALGGS